MLIEKTGDLLPLLAQAMGGEHFKNYFQAFLPEMMKRTVRGDVFFNKHPLKRAFLDKITVIFISMNLYRMTIYLSLEWNK
jgi:hypothetical protein